MKLKDLLKLAGVNSIDALNYAGAVADSEGVPAYRMTGMVIELQIDYTNKIPGYYEGSEYRARASIAKAPIGWAGLGAATDFTAHATPSAGNADGSFETYESYSYGVKIVVKATGEIGHFDFFFLMAVVTQFFVYWGLGVVAAEFVASSLLGEKSVDYVDDQRDYTHCVQPPRVDARRAARALDEPRGLGQGRQAAAQELRISTQAGPSTRGLAHHS